MFPGGGFDQEKTAAGWPEARHRRPDPPELGSGRAPLRDPDYGRSSIDRATRSASGLSGCSLTKVRARALARRCSPL
jgi:hypothetical protein